MEHVQKENTTNINIRINADLKKEAETLFDSMGMNLTTGIKIYLSQVVREGGLPFTPCIMPNAETRAAIEEGEKILSTGAPRFSTAEELFDDLGI